VTENALLFLSRPSYIRRRNITLLTLSYRSEINLNGGIVANKGFIRQMAGPNTTVIAGSYISAWGGIQSAGQTIGQIVS
jgi:hypothetical protein